MSRQTLAMAPGATARVVRALGAICALWSCATLASAAQGQQKMTDDAPATHSTASPPPAHRLAQQMPRDAAQSASDVASQSAADVAAQHPASPARSRASDRLELDTSVVTGNRELPKVLYIVPWKKAGIGDLPEQPFNTLLDEVLTPVDRDVFRREVTYFDAVAGHGDPSSADTGAADRSGGGSEK